MSEASIQLISGASWHDCKLVEVRLYSSTDVADTFELHIDRPVAGAGARMRRFVITLVGCRVLEVDLDLLGKRLCSDDIRRLEFDRSPGAGERLKSRARERFDMPDERLPLESLAYFRVALINPGGQIEALVRDVECVEA